MRFSGLPQEPNPASVIAKNYELVRSLGYSDLTKRILENFAFLSELPRRHPFEGQCIEAMILWAKRNNAKFEKDETGNLIIDFPGNGAKPVGLQFHIDGVVAKELSDEEEITRPPLELFVETKDGKEFLGAKNSTLMADNRAGGALMMALATDSELVDMPPLRLIVTVGEEVGLLGASKIDPKWLEPLQCLINLDSAPFGSITTSCVGGVRLEISLPCEREEKAQNSVHLVASLEGFPGGHSGSMISANIPNAIKYAALLCQIVCNNFTSARVVNLTGGSAMNAIPSEASFEFVVSKDSVRKVKEFLNRFKKILLEDTGEIKISEKENGDLPLTKASGKALFDLVKVIHDGVIKKGPPQVSSNLGKLRSENDKFVLGILARAAGSKEDLDDVVAAHTQAADGYYASTNILLSYYPWKVDSEAPIIQLAKDVMQRSGIAEVQIRGATGGIEPAHFANLAPSVPILSLGMDVTGLHTTEERLQLDTIEPAYKVLAEFLREVQTAPDETFRSTQSP